MKTLLIISLIIGSGSAFAQLSSPGVTPASPSSGIGPATTPSTSGVGTSTPESPTGDFNSFNNSPNTFGGTGDFNSFNNSTTTTTPAAPNTFNFGEGTGFGNTDSGTGNSLQNSAFGPTSPLPNVSPQGFGTTTPNNMQPGNQFNNAGNPNLTPDSSLPQNDSSIQAQEFDQNGFQNQRPGF